MRAVFDVMTPLGHDYRRNSMLEDELFLVVGFQNYRVFVKGPNPPGKLHPTEQVDRDLRFIFARSIEERVLNVLRRLVFHLPIFLLDDIHMFLDPVDRFSLILKFIVAVQVHAIKRVPGASRRNAKISTRVKSSVSKLALQVPMLDLSRQYASIRSEVLAAVSRVCDSQRYILSDEVKAFEAEFADLIGVQEAVGCASGTDALWLALAAAGVGPGHEVITSPFSFFATASCVVRAGGRPAFADIDPDTLNLDPDSTERKIRISSSRLRALIPVHLYGQCADMEALNRLGAEYKLAVIEDAAQAVGAKWNGKPAGSMGQSATFSFYPTKNLSAFGDAGALTTNDPEIAEHLRRLRNHGGKNRYYHDEIGANSRLDAIQAAVLRAKMPHLAQWNSERGERALTYTRLLEASGLTGAGKIVLLKTRPQADHIYHQYVVRAQSRDQLRTFLNEHGVSTEIYYPVPLHLQKCFAYLGYAQGDFPEAERAATEVLALPMFAELREDEQQYVVECIADFYS